METMRGSIVVGDVLDVLSGMAAESVHCVVTSPPYWGLRDYGVDGQIGLERTVDEYVEKMVAVFREVRRVLRKDGTCWLNLGDAYCSGTSAVRSATSTQGPKVPAGWSNRNQKERIGAGNGLKAKDLIGIPWRVAFALQADGWWLRQDIIWSKPNPMPESVRDRCTRSHEYLFLLTKSARYWFDADAIKEPVKTTRPELLKFGPRPERGYTGNPDRRRLKTAGKWSEKDPQSSGRRIVDSVKTARAAGCGSHDSPFGDYRNKRSVWTVATQAYKEAHFATFPERLIEPCILAGCPDGGVVLDPFAGSGTSGVVAKRFGRGFVGIELNPAYAEMAERRMSNVQGMLA